METQNLIECLNCHIPQPENKFNSKKYCNKCWYLLYKNSYKNYYLKNKNKITKKLREQPKEERYFSKNKVEIRDRRRNKCHENRKYAMLIRAKSRARKLQLEFNLKESDLIIPEFCPILGVKLEYNTNGKGPSENSPSIDRINSNKGYTKDNIKIISNKANRLKSDMTLQQVESIYNYMKTNGRE